MRFNQVALIRPLVTITCFNEHAYYFLEAHFKKSINTWWSISTLALKDCIIHSL